MEGFIYNLRNDAMSGLAKLGFSKNVYCRMLSLYTTGVPMMFYCIFAKKVKDMRKAESFLFKDLAQYRLNPNKEFFQVSDDIIKESFDKIEGEYIDISKLNNDKQSKKSKQSEPSKQSKLSESSESSKSSEPFVNNNMPNFICKRCNVQFISKSNLKSHLQRKKICEFIDNDFDRDLLIDELSERTLNDKTFDCEYCNKKFNHSSTKSQHKKICKQRPLDKITILEKTVENLVFQIEDLKKKSI
jgi:hypothetical protein